MSEDLPVVACADRAAWEAWLDAHHGSAPGVVLKLAKKGTGIASVTQPDAVEVALCYGWIDGQGRRLDDRYWLQRFTPRRPRSRWSRINRERATELIERGEMRLAGLREVERAKADGRWDAAYEPPSTATVPEDLRAALDAQPRAAGTFAGLDSRNRYAILHRIGEAKRADTRARRIAKFVEMLARGDTPHP